MSDPKTLFCVRCGHNLLRHGPTVASGCTACACQCFAWPGSLEAAAIAAARAAIELRQAIVDSVIALCRKIAALAGRTK